MKHVYINVITALSNLIGYYYLYRYNTKLSPSLNLTIGISTLYHLSETKHNLPGIYPFNRYTGLFLNLDRLFSLYGLYIVLLYFSFLTYIDVLIGLTGLLCLAVSEYNSLRKFLKMCQLLRYVIQYVRKNRSKLNFRNAQVLLRDFKKFGVELFKILDLKYTTNLTLWTITHNIWHLCAYYVYVKCLSE